MIVEMRVISRRSMAGLYLHIPFCKQACHYCDFHFSTNTDLRAELLEAMKSEIELQKNYLEKKQITSIYFGGGTPSLLSPAEIRYLLDTVRENHIVDGAAEITLEANPDDLDEFKLNDLLASGINRLSIGIQSFEDDILKFLNRAHHARAALKSIQDSRAAGFQNISIDLMYAIPGLSEKTWQDSIQHVADNSVEHISAYALTVEPGTVFGVWSRKGKLKPVADDNAARQSEMLTSRLDEMGFEQYEVSNYCKPGMESRHNSSYWKQEPYLGIGPSAHSYNLKTRQFNISNNYSYVRSIQKKILPFEMETLSHTDLVNEYLLTTLRTKWGSDLDKLSNEFKYDILSRHGTFIESLIDRKLAVLNRSVLSLTKAGRLLADKITADLFLLF